MRQCFESIEIRRIENNFVEITIITQILPAPSYSLSLRDSFSEDPIQRRNSFKFECDEDGVAALTDVLFNIPLSGEIERFEEITSNVNLKNFYDGKTLIGKAHEEFGWKEEEDA